MVWEESNIKLRSECLFLRQIPLPQEEQREGSAFHAWKDLAIPTFQPCHLHWSSPSVSSVQLGLISASFPTSRAGLRDASTGIPLPRQLKQLPVSNPNLIHPSLVSVLSFPKQRSKRENRGSAASSTCFHRDLLRKHARQRWRLERKAPWLVLVYHRLSLAGYPAAPVSEDGDEEFPWPCRKQGFLILPANLGASGRDKSMDAIRVSPICL